MNGSEAPELEYLEDKTKHWVTQVEHIVLPPALNFGAFLSRVTRTIQYPSPTTSFTQKECQHLERQLYPKTLSVVLHLNFR